MLKTVYKGFRGLAAFLFEPSPRVVVETERRSARLLSAILLVLTLSNLSGALFTPESLHLVRNLMTYAELPLVLFYLLSRSRFYLLAAILTIATEMMISYGSLSHLPSYDMQTVAANIMWLLLPMFVAVIILPLALSLLFLAINFVVLLTMPGWVNGFEYSHLGNGLSFVVIASVLLLVIAAIRKRDVDELHSNSIQLQQQKDWLEQEVEERRQVELEVGSLQALINSISEAVLLISSQGMVERTNDTFGKMFGFSPEQMNNRHINDLLLKTPGAQLQEQLFPTLLREEQSDGRSWFAFRATRRDGSDFPAEAHAEHIKFGGRGHFVITIRDMTEHKRIEAMKDEFVSSVSHELRTPLTSIFGAISIIKGRYDGQLNDKLKQLIDIAYENCTSLNNLVEDILDIAKLESGRVHIENQRLSLDGLLRDILQNCQPMAEEFHVHFRLLEDCDDIELNIDKKRFTQVMNNLLSNAAKHSPKDTDVDVDCRVDGDWVWVSVTDYGEGIPKEYQQKIFDKFFQLEGTTKQKRTGTGLGLSISQHLIKQMAGSIGVESVPGHTRFSIKLPKGQGFAL